MLQDVSNQQLQNGSGASSPSLVGDLKRRWNDDEPDRLAVKRSLATSSSPGPRTSSSSPTNTRFQAYDAPTSPESALSHKFASSLPPSSPTFDPSHAIDAEKSPTLIAAVANVIASSTTSATSTSDLTGSTLHNVARPIQIEEHDFDDPSATQRLSLERGVVMQFGRKAKRPTQPRPETTLPVQLPKSAKHASRMHCTLRILPREGRTSANKVMVEASVMGMNGMKIDGKLYRKGSIAVLPVRVGHELQLSLWSWQGVVHVAESEVDGDAEAARTLLGRLSSPLSLSAYDSLYDDSDRGHRDGSFELADPNNDDEDAVSRGVRAASPAPSEQSVLSALPSSPLAVESASGDLDEDNALSARATELAHSLGLDLQGLIASSIVFSPRSTIGVEDVVRALLKDVGAMWDVLEDGKGSDDQSEEREDRAVEAWWEVVERVLCKEPFFGCIDNAGLKDASGHPLLPAFFYMPDSDPSPSRVAALEPFVKRVRGARQRPAQYFWRKPSLRKNR